MRSVRWSNRILGYHAGEGRRNNVYGTVSALFFSSGDVSGGYSIQYQTTKSKKFGGERARHSSR